MKPLTSVIVPVYNTEEYLPRCIESIQKQTYSNMEIILVNDGSTDNSLSVCEKYAGMDDRIQIISQSNQGIIAAKRAGIKLCHGEYVMFVDSDDWIEPQLLESMVQTVHESGCILVCTNVYQDLENGTTVECRNAIPSDVYETGTIAKDLFYYKNTENYGILPYSVAKLYTRDMIKEVLSQIGDGIYFAEDKAIVFSIVFQNVRVCFTDDIYYHYCVRDGSVCQSENHDYLVELTAFYKYVKKIFDGHKEREHLLWQLGKYMWGEVRAAVNKKLGLVTPGKSIDREPYRLDSSVFLVPRKKIILYGAGKVGADYHKQITDCMNMELCGWVDKDYVKYQEEELDVRPIEYMKKVEYDYILVAVWKKTVFIEIKEQLVEMGINEDAIIWGRPHGAPYEND